MCVCVNCYDVGKRLKKEGTSGNRSTASAEENLPEMWQFKFGRQGVRDFFLSALWR